MGQLKKGFLIGFVSCALLSGCVGFSYRYYTMQLVSYQGRLLAQKEADDKDFAQCMPTASDKNPCIVMFTNEFLSFKQDHLDCQQKLSDCQKSCK